jgi:hypothetical protein
LDVEGPSRSTALLEKIAGCRGQVTIRSRKVTSSDSIVKRKGTNMTDRARSAKSTAKKAPARPRPRADKGDGENEVLAKIAAMPEPFRAMGERLHAIVKASAPVLAPKVWYGMPGYARDGKCVCFFRSDKYLTFGFTEAANLFDEGARMQASSFSLKELTAAEEARIGELVKKAAS